MEQGFTELVFKRNRSVVVIEGVPALVCKQCGEASIDMKTSQAAYDLADFEIKRGVFLEFCKFKVV
jgi:YgiT-type zinc finger domain-containing protein